MSELNMSIEPSSNDLHIEVQSGNQPNVQMSELNLEPDQQPSNMRRDILLPNDVQVPRDLFRLSLEAESKSACRHGSSHRPSCQPQH